MTPLGSLAIHCLVWPAVALGVEEVEKVKLKFPEEQNTLLLSYSFMLVLINLVN